MNEAPLDESHPDWFPGTVDLATDQELQGIELSRFLRKKGSPRDFRKDASARKDPRVYLHAGTDADFFERFPSLPNSPRVSAHLSVYTSPSKPSSEEDGAWFGWDLSGACFDCDDAPFRVFDLRREVWIGSGIVSVWGEAEGLGYVQVTAYSQTGRWCDFCGLTDDCSDLVLVIFRAQ